ncbi:hypothetical protein L249_0483 [Ophiocordyceps polyrhachis-furcata BCC 54312]|uniref:FAD-binding FR-type domain-containing protein n=1 Tax=Ophiocordyceps polyrhachis-furcata BCC 54312 TaxID=1330021 RepID=A0A367LEX5_9HYPO|nr:hypothetical protein L249_0483 [Ophiocordyceps polyrhachis-furcata BCC 54312]
MNGSTNVSKPATSNADLAAAESTVVPYYTGLNGVDLRTNTLSADILWLILGLVALVMLAIRFSETIWARHRQCSAASMPYGQQNEWRTTQWSWLPRLKKHLLYAPLLRKRHNREFRPLPAVNLGTLPSRPYCIFIVLYLAANVATMSILLLNRGNPNGYAVVAELRGRSGTLAVANMVPLIILAGRNNPLIPLLKISYDSFNMLHRWLGRLVVVQIVVHAACWTDVAVVDGGFKHAFAVASRNDSFFMRSGVAGCIAAVFLLLLSSSPLRHAFYETFVNLHIVLALAVFVTTWIHCASSDVDRGLPQLPWIMAVVMLWLADRLARVLRTLYLHWPRGFASTAVCEALPGRVTRVTVQLPRYLDIKPGAHAFLRIWGIDLWQSHPFSVAWVDHHADPPGVDKDRRSDGPTRATFLISARHGMTGKLFERASCSPKGIRVKATTEGPYGGYSGLDSYGHVVLIAGSTGITHQLSYIKPLIQGYNKGAVALRRLVLCWIIREEQWMEWIRPHMDAILGLPRSEHVLSIQVYLTRRRNPLDHDPGPVPLIRVFWGRPDVSRLVADEVRQQVGAMCVTVCGPGALADDVRSSVRAVQGSNNVVDYIEESFTW